MIYRSLPNIIFAVRIYSYRHRVQKQNAFYYKTIFCSASFWEKFLCMKIVYHEIYSIMQVYYVPGLCKTSPSYLYRIGYNTLVYVEGLHVSGSIHAAVVIDKDAPFPHIASLTATFVRR